MTTGQVPKEVFGKDYFTIVPEACAILVIDMQNGFIEKGATFQAPNGLDIIPSIDSLVEYGRAHTIPVIWTQSDHSPPGGGLVLERYPIIKHKGLFWKGDPSFELYKSMSQPEPGEHRIEKHKYDAFHDTDLDAVLRNMKKDTVIISGVATEVCCESTARAAFFHDYKVVFLRDATAAFNPELQDLTCDRMDQLFARVINTKELLDTLIGGKE